ncbi:MAG: Blue-light-activated protein [Pseudomonas citronellolis]|nr:MAG: Blue-light-activated protein [Pseudomonas citronellolis]
MHTDNNPTRLIEDARYRLLVEAVTDYAIYMLDPDGLVSSWNPGAQHFKGYSANEIIGQHFSRFYLPEDCANGLPQNALRIAGAEGRYESEGWRLRKDGTRFWAHAVIDAIRSPEGELLGFAKITRDLSERRAAEQALRESERRFRLLVNGVTDYALYMLDPEGRVSNWNAGAERISGYRPDEIIGQPFDCFFVPEERDAGAPLHSLEVARSEGRFESEGWRLRKDGTRFWANVVIDSVYDNGELIGFAKITRDITDQRNAREELERARNELVQSQKMEALGQLTGGVAHDFNNLLTVIIGGLQMLRRHLPDEPRVQDLLRNSLEATQRGAQLTQRMLAFARRQRLFPRPIDLAELLDGMRDLLASSLGPGIIIERQIDADLDLVMSDENQLELSIINLATNARDAMPGGGRLRIEASNRLVEVGDPSRLEPGRYVRISVIDQGSGMDEATLRRAAEPFFTSKGPGKGTGLGLSIVHGLAHQQGGKLELLSEAGVGTTVHVWLPAVSERRQPRERPAAEAEPLRQYGLRVLLVDDDALVLRTTAQMLVDLGCQVTSLDGAAAALEHLHEDAGYDLLLSDFAMPETNGLQLIALVRKDWPALRCMLSTGYAAPVESHPQDVLRLAKPFGVMQMVAVLDRLAPPTTR